MNRAAHSFFAVFIGWLLPFIGLLSWMQFRTTGFGYITDFEFFLFWPLIFTFLGWLVVGLPLALKIGKGKETRFWVSVVCWTLATTVSFLLVAALFQFGIIFLIWWPVLSGAIAGSLFWLLQVKNSVPAVVAWVSPIIFFPFVRFVLLPIGIAYFPYTTHVIAEGAIGQEALYAVIERIEVGDTFEELNRKYPQIFDQPILGTSSSSGNGWSYSIKFDDGRAKVIEIEVNKPNANKAREATP
jgi:hypothetical protein